MIFKEGDKVFDIRYGWGEVLEINEWKGNLYPIVVRFNTTPYNVCYEPSGTPYGMDIPLLSFTEYTLQGFSQERPKKEPKIGSLCLFNHDLREFERNIGVVRILGAIHTNGKYSPTGPGSHVEFEFCKQIKIQEL